MAVDPCTSATLGDGGNSMSVMKSHSVLFTNINGNKQQHEDRKEQVEKNGELVARVQQQLDKDGQNAEPHVKTSLDIPSRNVHRVVEHGPKGQRPPVMPFKQPEAKVALPPVLIFFQQEVYLECHAQELEATYVTPPKKLKSVHGAQIFLCLGNSTDFGQ
uniref:Uncharacterized protein n=1 Tax=Rhodnius prolixus TaxID=13249 RepID=T1HRV1_RHOPR